METKKFVINVMMIEKRPEEWTSCTAWPGVGTYKCIDGDALYNVTKFTVDYIGTGECFMANPITEDQLASPLSESLFLKAIAAASRAEVLR
jgi:hypothetical protein